VSISGEDLNISIPLVESILNYCIIITDIYNSSQGGKRDQQLADEREEHHQHDNCIYLTGRFGILKIDLACTLVDIIERKYIGVFTVTMYGVQ